MRFVLSVSLGFFEKSARPTEITLLETCTQETAVFGSV